jgi:hypothetical protein
MPRLTLKASAMGPQLDNGFIEDLAGYPRLQVWGGKWEWLVRSDSLGDP